MIYIGFVEVPFHEGRAMSKVKCGIFLELFPLIPVPLVDLGLRQACLLGKLRNLVLRPLGSLVKFKKKDLYLSIVLARPILPGHMLLISSVTFLDGFPSQA
jgi:hypothetical protein